ncbi:MAG: Uncharacterized protein XD77_1495, partial [Marinimicrobia bacterium 46_47]
MNRIFHRLFSLLLMAALLFASVPDELVRLKKYEVFSEQENGKIHIALHFVIEQGWHINSYDPLDDYSIPARITLNDNPYFSVETVQYPEPHLVDLKSLGGKSSVYDGTVIIDLHLKQRKPVPTGTTLSGTLSYQGCDNEVCLIPMET